jgi:hypothetical protein
VKNDKIPGSCVVIETEKFPVLPGEDEEIVNPGMYGKALCQYLERELPRQGIEVPFFCNEDWGWWLEVNQGGFKMALCIYSCPEGDPNPKTYAILPSIPTAKKWSWSKFRSIDVSQDVLRVMNSLERLFQSDPEISSVTRHDDFPF